MAKEGYFYECPGCGEVHQLERSPNGIENMDELVSEAMNEAIQALSPIFGGVGRGIPLDMASSFMLFIAGYKYPEECKPEKEENHENSKA